MVGVVLAELLGVPHAALVKKIEAEGGKATVNCELEDGLESVFDVSLPAVFTIQTGINEPRYVSISRIRRAMRQEIEVLGLSDLGLSEGEVGESGSWLRVERVFIPPAEKDVVFLEGEIDETTARVAEILRERGLV
jgi:electron transfer flavoprotein beta subunit